MPFNLDFANNTISSCFFVFFLIIDLYFLVCAAIKLIVDPIAELIIPTGIATKEAKAEMETHPLIVENKISKYSIYFKILQTSFMLLTH